MTLHAVGNFPIEAGAVELVSKPADENRLSTATLADDSDLSVSLLASRIHAFELTAFFGISGSGTTGFKYDLNYTGTFTGALLFHPMIGAVVEAGGLMFDVIPEELAWLESSIAVVQAVAASAATAELLASLGDGRPLTPASLAAWSAEVRETAKADRAGSEGAPDDDRVVSSTAGLAVRSR